MAALLLLFAMKLMWIGMMGKHQRNVELVFLQAAQRMWSLSKNSASRCLSGVLSAFFTFSCSGAVTEVGNTTSLRTSTTTITTRTLSHCQSHEFAAVSYHVARDVVLPPIDRILVVRTYGFFITHPSPSYASRCSFVHATFDSPNVVIVWS